MKYFTKCKCIEDVKEEFKRLAKELHPDNGGNAEEFKIMMQAYTAACGRFKGVHRAEGANDSKKAEKATQGAHSATEDDLEQFAEIISKVVTLDGVEIEIVGTWVWLSGNTYPHREAIKAAGFFWSTKHKRWYYNGSTKKSKKHSKYSYDEVKNMHGCKEVKTSHRYKLA